MPVFHVLGTCAGWPEPGRACSGYLIEHAGTFLVLDLGTATLPRDLALVPDLERIAAIGVSHAHRDHVSDLIGMCRAAALTGQGHRWPLVAPAGVRETVTAGDPESGAFDVGRTLAVEADQIRVGPFEVTTCPTPRHLPNLAIRVEVDGAVLIYTGDTGPGRGLAEFAHGADVLVS